MELVFGGVELLVIDKVITHKATFSEDLPSTRLVKILTFKDDLVLDCFSGSGTTAISVSKKVRKKVFGI